MRVALVRLSENYAASGCTLAYWQSDLSGIQQTVAVSRPLPPTRACKRQGIRYWARNRSADDEFFNADRPASQVPRLRNDERPLLHLLPKLSADAAHEAVGLLPIDQTPKARCRRSAPRTRVLPSRRRKPGCRRWTPSALRRRLLPGRCTATAVGAIGLLSKGSPRQRRTVTHRPNHEQRQQLSRMK